ncbi:hypothetical protein L210DRAFT_2493487 [Boletus edulis BED1]|uniref:Uncharacterized protein n=1 Tax=Boletus edulis BED1 TaxID=1328754 RepID=A0AAD4BNN2_BOLED|nr:hypothetical protein L210DRAFT_2493487 [Boletus edulis BED1]
MSYRDKYIAPLIETMLPADTFWILPNMCVFPRPLIWAVCFFFGPMVSDVISMTRIMCQLTLICSYFIFTTMFVMQRCLGKLTPMRRVCCFPSALALTR